MFRKSERGFTLVELLVVIAILGVLAGIAVPRVVGALENARRGANIANRAIVQSAVDRFFIDTSRWPIVTDPVGGSTTPVAGVLDQTLLAPYLSGGALPRVNEVPMPNNANPPVNNVEVTAANRWGLNTGGTVVLIPSAAVTQVWPVPPTP